MFQKTIIVLLLLFSTVLLFPQTQEDALRYRSDEVGDRQYRREGIMDGNQVRTRYYNNGEVGQWPYSMSLEWPKGTNHLYCDGVAVLIAAEIETDAGLIHSLETSYREWMDTDPINGTIWGLEPVPGYLNEEYEKPAVSTDSLSWPDIWPRVLPNIDQKWDGYWYGYFGRGVKNADFETFFVMDDSKDGEFFRPPYNYMPIPGDSTRKGLGLRVEVRGFQWSHVLAEDIIFWHYDIVNISEDNHEKTYFGFYSDTGVGGSSDNGDDNASFDVELDICYGYDSDGYGVPGRWETGYYGYAYLESPGNATDGIDNDLDGMVDERRDDGIDNDGDWIPFTDLNENGKWDPEESEPLNNDVGQDGVGPFDSQYTGPDEGEGDGLPTDGEPNFDKTDKDESDQIGLTSVSIYRLGDGGVGGGWPKDDESMWLKMASEQFDTSLQRANISVVFGSGAFPLDKYLRERFSMALVFGEDFEDLIFNKETVQQIYDANYNFARPPLKPHVTAVPGDGEVFLYWDDVAEESRDPFLGFENDDPTLGYKKDFEGYMIYRSTEPEFNDIKVVTDSKGNEKFWKPIAQFDLVDGIYGPDPVGVNGASFWRGDETGLQHSFVDKDVINGQKYYYAIVSYDMGDPSFGTKGLTPSECTKIISVDFNNVATFVDYNCAIVTPNAPSAGYIPAAIEGDFSEVAGNGSGTMEVVILNPLEVKEGAQYQVLFDSDTLEYDYATTGYSILREYEGSVDTVIARVDSSEIGEGKFSPPFDGITVSVNNDSEVGVDYQNTGWLVGTSNLEMTPLLYDSKGAVAWPSDYEIRFYDEVVDTGYQGSLVNFHVVNTTRNEEVEFYIIDDNGNKELDIGESLVIIEFVGKQFKLTWQIDFFFVSSGGTMPIMPKGGDIFQLKISKPFYKGDTFSFSTKAPDVDKDMAKSDLDKIKVVPNPYVATNKWEPRSLNQTGRGDRRIDFIHLPAECTVRIYTVTGQLIKTLYKEYGASDGTLTWNLVTDDGMDCAYGMYIYHIDAGDIGEHIGKFVIIK